MKIIYICVKCGKETPGKYKENLQRGSYMAVKCECGNKGLSDWYYNIKGFVKNG